MLKKLFLLLLCLGALCFAWAEVSVLSVTDEDKHQNTTDFYHTYEYYIMGDNEGTKCQATRIAPHWFATAAHCVKERCDKGCTLRMDLMDTPVSVLAQTTHSPRHRAVFIHPGYKPSTWAKDDFALIKLDVRNAEKLYYRRATAKEPQNVGIQKQEFLAWLKSHPQAKRKYNKALSPELPPLVDFSVSRNYQIDRKLSVVSIFSGVRKVKKATAPVYYISSLGYAYTTNFGIQKGMSGSGVMTNTGELIGIISAFIDAQKKQGAKTLAQYDWFVFPVFNASIIEFMRDTMGSDFSKMDRKDAEPSFVSKTRKDFTDVEMVMKGSKSTDKKKTSH